MSTFLKHRSTWLLTIAAFAILVAVLIAQVPRQTRPPSLQGRAMLPGKTQETQQRNTPKRKYELKDSIKGIKFAVRNLESDDWVEKLEVEIKNISDKPIYYIRIAARLHEVKPPPYYNILSFDMRFGNKRHLNIGSLAEPGDESIKPGESLVLKIPEGQVQGWNKMKSEQEYPPITRVEFYVATINFGDGSGYKGSELRTRKPVRVSEDGQIISGQTGGSSYNRQVASNLKADSWSVGNFFSSSSGGSARRATGNSTQSSGAS
jgi:hypothetical protein